MGCAVIKSFISSWAPSLPGTIFTTTEGIRPVLPRKQAGELNVEFHNRICALVYWSLKRIQSNKSNALENTF